MKNPTIPPPPEQKSNFYARSISSYIDANVDHFKEQLAILNSQISDYNIQIGDMKQEEKDEDIGGFHPSLRHAEYEREKLLQLRVELSPWLTYTEKVKEWYMNKIFSMIDDK